ncbi:MAG TPA: histidine phosphatase family protein [Ktedonobacteraceae bacterium]|nr:histidine phosphatase family protein [Ktedonobacteraceae bacterium]
MSELSVPASTISNLGLAQPKGNTVLLLRHSHRFPLPDSLLSSGSEVDLTPEGIRMAEELGGMLQRFRPGLLQTSPVLRCVHTLQVIRKGAGWDVPITTDWRLGKPGAFIIDPQIANTVETWPDHA